MKLNDESIQRRIYTVSELTANIKALLEDNFPFVWISGEITNLRMPISGHLYFTLKDEYAQIDAVIFRGQKQNLKFNPEDGISVAGLGRITVYEPRGSYQIILEYLEPKGIGALQIAFEQLKARLSKEGLFDEKYKKPLPFLPRKISLITSPMGAAVHDILKIISRRFSNLHIEIIPVKVQGDGAEKEIAYGLKALNSRGDADVAILTRGGGSIEDLFAFNSEEVARAIFSSDIPIISAVGHETDFTIADFVADLRAPTPSAAAELVVPLKDDLVRRLAELSRALSTRLYKYLEYHYTLLNSITKRLVDPRKKIQDLRLRIDDFENRLFKLFFNHRARKAERLSWWIDRLYTNNPVIQIKSNNEKLAQKHDNLLSSIRTYLNDRHNKLRELSSKLNVLSPAAILGRGYSITRTIPDSIVVRDPQKVAIGQDLEVMVEKGSLRVNVVKGK